MPKHRLKYRAEGSQDNLVMELKR